MTFQNLAGYYFFNFKGVQSLRYPLRDMGRSLELTGTVLMGEEGVNLAISGQPEKLEQFLSHFYKVTGIPPIDFRKSWSEKSPYKRFLVKVKKEIVTMGQGTLPVADLSKNHLPPAELKRWLDEGREFTFLDTRNEFEVKLGKFSRATDLGVRSFREFARKAQSLSQDLRQKPVVMYCTGGIRCEKASVYFRQHLGFSEVYQLQGGILKYFEECGSEHYEGECFVFDQRIGVDGHLAETPTAQCVRCRRALPHTPATHSYKKTVEHCSHCET